MDFIGNKLLRNLPKFVLFYIFNNLFLNGKFPLAWYQCRVIPIPKPNQNHITTYRPIRFLLSCTGKVMEKLFRLDLSGGVYIIQNIRIHSSGLEKDRVLIIVYLRYLLLFVGRSPSGKYVCLCVY